MDSDFRTIRPFCIRKNRAVWGVTMELAEIKQLLESHLTDCDVEVSGDGRHIEVTVIGDVFEGLRPVKKQQLVLAALSAQFADGSIHAVDNMKLYTRAEWQQAQ